MVALRGSLLCQQIISCYSSPETEIQNKDVDEVAVSCHCHIFLFTECSISKRGQQADFPLRPGFDPRHGRKWESW